MELLEKLLDYQPNTDLNREDAIRQLIHGFEEALKNFFTSTLKINQKQILLTPIGGKYLDQTDERDLDFFQLDIKPLSFYIEPSSEKDRIIEAFVKFASINFVLQQSATNYLNEKFSKGSSDKFPLFIGFQNENQLDEVWIQMGRLDEKYHIDKEALRKVETWLCGSPTFHEPISEFWLKSNIHFSNKISSEGVNQKDKNNILFANIALLSKATGLISHHYFPSIEFIGKNNQTFAFGNIVVSSNKPLGKDRLKLLRIAGGILFSQIGMIEQTYHGKKRFFEAAISTLKNTPENYFSLAELVWKSPNDRIFLTRMNEEGDNNLKYAVRTLAVNYKKEIETFLKEKEGEITENDCVDVKFQDKVVTLPLLYFTIPFVSSMTPRKLLESLLTFNLRDTLIFFHLFFESKNENTGTRYGHPYDLSQKLDTEVFWQIYKDKLLSYKDDLQLNCPELFQEVFKKLFEGIEIRNIDFLTEGCTIFSEKVNKVKIGKETQKSKKLNEPSNPSIFFWEKDYKHILETITENLKHHSSQRNNKEWTNFFITIEKGTIIFKTDNKSCDEKNWDGIYLSINEKPPIQQKISYVKWLVCNLYYGKLYIVSKDNNNSKVIYAEKSSSIKRLEERNNDETNLFKDLSDGTYYILKFD